MVDSQEPEKCACGKPAHPLYGGSCEDCFAERQFSGSGFYTDELSKRRQHFHSSLAVDADKGYASAPDRHWRAIDDDE